MGKTAPMTAAAAMLISTVLPPATPSPTGYGILVAVVTGTGNGNGTFVAVVTGNVYGIGIRTGDISRFSALRSH